MIATKKRRFISQVNDHSYTDQRSQRAERRGAEGKRGMEREKKKIKAQEVAYPSATCSAEETRREVVTGGRQNNASPPWPSMPKDILPSHGRAAPLDTRRRGVTTRAPLHVVADLDRDFVSIVPRNPNHQRCLLLAPQPNVEQEKRKTRGTGGERRRGRRREKRGRSASKALLENCPFFSPLRYGPSFRCAPIPRLSFAMQRANKMATVVTVTVVVAAAAVADTGAACARELPLAAISGRAIWFFPNSL